MNRGRVGEERGSKEKDGCPLTIGWKEPAGAVELGELGPLSGDNHPIDVRTLCYIHERMLRGRHTRCKECVCQA
jgi:hypothetical protein